MIYFQNWKERGTTPELKTTIIKSKHRFKNKRRGYIELKQTMTARHLSQKQLNFARISIVCVDIIKLPLEDILNIFIKPTELVKNINACQSLLTGKFKLNPDQKTKCCFNSTNLPDYSRFDVSLLYKLIRNLCPDPSLGPTSKWGITPTKNDVCVVDDIERIRELRNASFAHTKSAEISDDDFKKFWHDAKCIISRCQQFTTSKGCNKDYNQMLIDLERRTLTFDEYISRRERSGGKHCNSINMKQRKKKKEKRTTKNKNKSIQTEKTINRSTCTYNNISCGFFLI